MLNVATTTTPTNTNLLIHRAHLKYSGNFLMIDFDQKSIKPSIKFNWHHWRIERDRIVTNSI